MQALREYQINAIAGVHNAWQSGNRSVLLVAPTGSGKTRMGEEPVFSEISAGGKVLWIAHRRELITQAADRMRSRFGHLDVGLIAPGESLDLYSPIQVATVQTLLARKHRPEATLTVFDEAHHYIADDWKAIAEQYPHARMLGLTATPERQDGKPLGDVYTALVVAAKYSELLRDGHLVPCRVYQPPETMAGNELAQDPLLAWQRYAEGSRTFAFCSNVQAAYDLAARFRSSGVAAATVEANTPKNERTEILERFADGEITVITNVYALTEGVDIPAARCVLLARSCGHVGPFLQMAGRILRPAEGKRDSILIDLTGATIVHGLPTEDREYSLDGEGIKRTSPAPLRNCMRCGATLPAQQRRCPECGYEAPEHDTPQPRIYSFELREVYAGADTPSTAKTREFARLAKLVEDKNWHPYFVIKNFRQLFHHDPTDELKSMPLDARRLWFNRIKSAADKNGMSINRVRGMYKGIFQDWPPWSWR